MVSIGASAARAALPDLLTRVEQGEEVVIVRHGRPVAVLVSPASLRARRATEVHEGAARLRALLDEAAAEPFSGTAGELTAERAEELIASLRADRAAR